MSAERLQLQNKNIRSLKTKVEELQRQVKQYQDILENDVKMLNSEHIADIHSQGIAKTKQVLNSVDSKIREK